MIKYLLCIVIIIFAFVIVNKAIANKEGFDTYSTNVDFSTHPDMAFRQQASIVDEGSVGASDATSSGEDGDTELQVPSINDFNPGNDYVLKSDIERAARASALKYCPVPPDFNPADYIKKSSIDLERTCPKMPDLKDYVLKSTIPPVQKCPACVCPKVKVSAGMCKECPTPKNNCPPCKPCGVEECASVIKCASNEKPVSCPKCPPPQPCPEPPEKVCPAFELPTSDIKCPSPKPCPLPQPCPDSQGRCPEKPDSKCKYYGIKEVVREKSVDRIVNELLLSDDPELQELLETLKSKIDLNNTPAPTALASEEPPMVPTTPPLVPTTPPMVPTTQPRAPTTQPRAPTTQPRAPTTQPRAPTTQPRAPTTQPRAPTTPAPAPTTSLLLPGASTQSAKNIENNSNNRQAQQASNAGTFGSPVAASANSNLDPRPINRTNNQYEFNTSGYSRLNNLNYLGDPTPAFNSGIQNTPLEGASNLGCDISNGNCSYNTNLNI